MSAFVFLDRDGTLVRDSGYTHRIEDYALLPGVRDGLSALVRAGFGLAVVTNQSGIGRGYFDESQYQAFAAHLESDLAAQGIEIARTYHCPHRPDAGCTCRKPAAGLLDRAQRELGADLAKSWVVGNAEADVELALHAGCRGAVWVHPEAAAPDPALHPDVPRAADVAEAARLILEERPGRARA